MDWRVSTTRKTEGKRQQRQNHHPIQLHLGHLLSGYFHPPRQHESILFEAREWEIVATKERTRRCFRVNALGQPADKKDMPGRPSSDLEVTIQA